MSSLPSLNKTSPPTCSEQHDDSGGTEEQSRDRDTAEIIPATGPRQGGRGGWGWGHRCERLDQVDEIDCRNSASGYDDLLTATGDRDIDRAGAPIEHFGDGARRAGRDSVETPRECS